MGCWSCSKAPHPPRTHRKEPGHGNDNVTQREAKYTGKLQEKPGFLKVGSDPKKGRMHEFKTTSQPGNDIGFKSPQTAVKAGGEGSVAGT